jgi:colanic acid/amylovoran biosynthesis glycosyltransferase
MGQRPIRIIYLCTTFPRLSETFVQREVRALRSQTADLQIFSLFGGEDTFEDKPVHRFPLWQLTSLLWWIPYWMIRRPKALHDCLALAFNRPFPQFLNWAENFLGFGFAVCQARRIEKLKPDLLHAIWATAPAAAAWMIHRLTQLPFSMGAHAYDVFQAGGDTFLSEKIKAARFIHTTTDFARQRLLSLGARPDQVHLIRRGLDLIPDFAPERPPPPPLRLLSIGRLVPKKGFRFLLEIATALKAEGIEFDLSIIGEGGLRQELEALIAEKKLGGHVRLLGALSNEATLAAYTQAHAYCFTGRVATDGDRDGLPNVVAEAMAFALPVFTTPVEGVLEAIQDGVTGTVLPYDAPREWVEALSTFSRDPSTKTKETAAAYAWINQNFRAEENSGRLFSLFTQHTNGN